MHPSPVSRLFRLLPFCLMLLALATTQARAESNKLYQFFYMKVAASGGQGGILYVGPVVGTTYEDSVREQEKFHQRVRRTFPQGPFSEVKRQGENPYHEGREGMRQARDEFIDAFLKSTGGKGLVHEV